jgi:2-polyprenyl-3-methyl-5-hydroxy-6-metoxy-1,4-benzoquinol methylase
MNIFKLLLKYFRLILFNQYREKKLSDYITFQISNFLNNKTNLSILDFGSGKNPLVIYLIYEKLMVLYPNLNIKIECFDIYKSSEITKLNNKYKNINFYHIDDFDNKKNIYDFSLILDVLHHIDIRKKNIILDIIKNLYINSQFVIIKDHFYYNNFSKLTLRVMDFIGNFYNDVSIPKIYFTQKEYNDILDKNNIIELKRITKYYYYKKIWLFFSNPHLHFISILSKNNEL